jgi:hypothetical protein
VQLGANLQARLGGQATAFGEIRLLGFFAAGDQAHGAIHPGQIARL